MIEKVYNKYWFYIISFLPILFINIENNWGGDFAVYINQSIHFLNGNIQNLYEKQLLLSGYEKSGPYLYPMGVPILLSPIIFLFGSSFIHLKIYGVFFWVGSLYYLKRYLEGFFPGNKSIFFTLLITQFSFVYYQIMDSVLSDIYFFFFFNLFLFLFSNLNKKKENLYLTGVVLFVLNIIRPTGIVIIILYSFFLIYNTFKKRRLIFLSPLLIFLTLHLTYSYVFNFDFASNEFNSIKQNIGINSILSNIKSYTIMISEYFTGGLFKIVRDLSFKIVISVFLVLISSIHIFLYYKKVKRSLINNSLPLIIITICFLGFYILLPMTNGIRFLFPILPLISFMLINSLSKRIVLTLILIQVFTVTSATVYYKSKNYTYKSNNIELTKTYEYINKNLTNDTIVFTKARVLNLFTKSISVPHTIETINKYNYVLYVKGVSEEDNKLYKNHSLIVYESENVKILKNEK